jgi:hypothetical protein
MLGGANGQVNARGAGCSRRVGLPEDTHDTTKISYADKDHRVVHVASWHQIQQARLDANSNAMLRIRCAIDKGTFTQIFADYIAAEAARESSS